jgi:hypothetical protein
MPSVPRILRAVPRGGITRPEQGIPVVAWIRWHSGTVQDVPALATAWTREAVEVTWEAPQQGLRSDWIPAAAVRRGASPGGPPRSRTHR